MKSNTKQKNKKFGLAKYTKLQRKDFPFVYLLIALPVVQFLVFWLFVNVDSITLAFRNDIDGSFTMDHFVEVWQGIVGLDVYGFNLLEMAGRSFILWFVANVLAFPIGLFSTYVLYKKVWGHYAFRVIYLIPSLVGAIIWTSLVKAVVDWNGPVVYFLEKIGVQLDPIVKTQGLFASEKTAFPTLCVITFLLGIVGGNVIATGAFAKVPTELFEAGKIDGVNFFQEFFHIALPCAWPTVSTLLTVSLCTMLVADGSVFLYSNTTGQPGMATMGYYLYYMTYRISNSTAAVKPYGYPAAVGIVITLVSVPIVLFGRKLLDKIVENVEV